MELNNKTSKGLQVLISFGVILPLDKDQPKHSNKKADKEHIWQEQWSEETKKKRKR